MNTYLIERTNKKTNKSKTELVEAESVSLALLEQSKEYGEHYTYRLAGHLTVSKIDDHNKVNKDRLDRLHRYQKSMAESSYTNPFASPHRDYPNMAEYVDTTKR